MAATNVTLTLSHIRNHQNRQNSSSRFQISNRSRTNSLSVHSEFLPFSCKFTSSSSLLRKPVQRWNSLQVAAVRKLEESELIPVNEGGDVQIGKIPSAAGVYAIYNTEREVQFVGISRNVSESISAHAKAIHRLCSFVKVGIIDEPDRAVLTGAWKSWMEEHIAATGKVPPGNESGNTTFTRQPPKVKSDLRLTPGRGKELTISLEELIDKLVKETEVVVFIKGSRNAPQCGFSQRVVGILNSHGVNYESVDVLDEEYNSGLRETLKQYSNWPTFPQVYVKGELIGGADILASMAEKGELASVFGKS